jgi:hypothetical protein
VGNRELHLYRGSSPTSKNAATFIPSGGFPRYKCEVSPFVPVGATTRYKCPLTRARRGFLLTTRYKCEINTGTNHYRIIWLCRERDALGTGPIPLGTPCAEREHSTQCTRHRWAGKDLFAVSHVRSSRYMCQMGNIALDKTNFIKNQFQGSGPTGRLPWPHHRRSLPPPEPPPPPPL